MRLVPLAMALAALAATAPGAAAAKYHECQHPVTTGQEAYKLKNVSVRTACAFVRKLGKFVNADNGQGYAKLYGCHYPHKNAAGYPYIKIHHLFNWRLRIDHLYEFVAYRGRSSSAVGGTDFPLNCT